MDLSMEWNAVFSNTHIPYNKQIQECPHTNISSPHPWDPMKVAFPKILIIGVLSWRRCDI